MSGGNYTEYVYDATTPIRTSQMTAGDVELAYRQYDYFSDGTRERIYTGALCEKRFAHENGQLRSITDGEGRTSYVKYNDAFQLVAAGNGSATTTFDYDDQERRTRACLPNGVATRYIYHSTSGQISRVYDDVSDSSDSVTTYEYNMGGLGDHVTGVVDPEGHKTGFLRDGYGRVTHEVFYTGEGPYAEHATAEMVYDASVGNRLTQKVDMKGAITDYEYDGAGRLGIKEFTSAQSQFAGSVSYEYNTAGQITEVSATSPGAQGSTQMSLRRNSNGLLAARGAVFGATIEFDYDGIDRLQSVAYPNVSGTDTIEVGYAYDPANRLTDVDGLGRAADLTYNKANQVTKIERSPSGGAYTDDTLFSYDALGRLEEISHQWYDTYYLALNEATRSYEYNLNDVPTTVTIDDSREVHYEYDRVGRLTRESGHADEVETCVVLNGNGEITIDSGGDLGAAQSAMMVDMRVYVDSLPTSGNAILFERGASGSDNWLKFYIDTSGNLKASVDTDDESVTASLAGVPTGQWVNVMCSFQGNSGGLYVRINESTSSSTAVNGELGAFDGTPKIGTNFTGKIDEVHVRDTSTGTISYWENYEPGSSTLGLWHFDEGSGTSEPEDDPVEARYVRVWADEFEDNTAGNGIYKLILTDVTVRDSTGTNLSADVAASAIASSHQSASLPVSNIRDANQATLWGTVTHATPEAAPPEWAYVDLGSTKEIDEIAVTWQNNGHYIPPHWKLQTSDNASAWVDVRVFTGYTNPGVDETETVDPHQNATLDAGVSWSSGADDRGIVVYSSTYTYDKVGNRLSHTIEETGANPRYEDWTLEYNDLNQLVRRYNGSAWTIGSDRTEYAYDLNGNLIAATHETNDGSWGQEERWEYDWDVENQMTRATKYNSSDIFAGSVEYEYSLFSSGTRTGRMEVDSSGDVVEWLRYEVDNLKVLRVDERYDSDTDGIDAADPWRTVENRTHKRGLLGSLLFKEVFDYPNTYNTVGASTKVYYYGYDAVGNVVFVSEEGADESEKAYLFQQDAFGNELSAGAFDSDDWGAAREDRITEHQTGKELDAFTGLYYFAHRWYDAEVGRFLARDPLEQLPGYTLAENQPTRLVDASGLKPDDSKNRARGDALQEEIKLLACEGGKKHVGKTLPLVASPVGLGDTGYPEKHKGWSIPVGIHKLKYDERDGVRNPGWYYIHDYTSGGWIRRRVRYWVRDPELGDWLNAAIHPGRYSAGCWALKQSDFKVFHECFCKEPGKFVVINRVRPQEPQ